MSVVTVERAMRHSSTGMLHQKTWEHPMLIPQLPRRGGGPLKSPSRFYQQSFDRILPPSRWAKTSRMKSREFDTCNADRSAS
jgi:hypothetical protein